MYAVMDDSKVEGEESKVIVYSHALVTPDEAFILWFASNAIPPLYQRGEDILQFVNEHVNGHAFYACNHYRMYPVIWKRVKGSTQKAKKRNSTVRRLAVLADKNARRIAWQIEAEKRPLEDQVLTGTLSFYI